jgi:hypothetical protein
MCEYCVKLDVRMMGGVRRAEDGKGKHSNIG